jgi:hypothetical protein
VWIAFNLRVKAKGTTELVALRPNAAQAKLERLIRRLIAEGRPIRIVILKARQVGMCLDPNTRVLTADLQWVRIADLKLGDELVAVDESTPGGTGHHRRMRTGFVQGIRSVYEPGFLLEMSNGQRLVATGEHRFLCRGRRTTSLQWRCVRAMEVGDTIRWVTLPWEQPDFEDGWMGGFIDGEGSLRRKERAGVEASITQAVNPALGRAVAYLQRKGYHFRIDVDRRTPADSSVLGRHDVHRLVLGRMDEMFRLVGQTRPVRFLGEHWWIGKELPGKKSGTGRAEIVSIKRLPKQEMIDLQTSTKTFIAEGFVSHNSTWIAALFYHHSIHNRNRTGIVVAHDAESTEGLFDKIRTFQEDYEQAPDTRFNSKKKLDWPAPLRSQLGVQTAGKVEIGRSMTLDKLHLSEFAFWGQHTDKSYTACMNALADGPETMAFIESTANGYGGPFYDRYQEGKKAESEWESFFFAWWEEPQYRRPVPEGFKRTNADSDEKDLALYGDEEELAETYGLDDEQLAWRRWTIVNKCGSNLDTFRQEYPSNDVEAFLMSGRPALDVEALRRQLLAAERFNQETPPARGKLLGKYDPHGKLLAVRFVAGPGPLLVYRFPHERGQYAMGTDVSEGHGGDPAGTVVWHKRTLADICDLHGQFTPTELAHETNKLRLWYGNAATCCDATGVGQAFIVEYKKLTARMYFRMVKDKVTDKRRKELGFKFNESTRATLVDQYDALLRADGLTIRNQDAIQEHFTFTYNKKGKAEHAEGCHDDHVLKRMLCLEMIKQEPWRDPRIPHPKRRGPGASVPGG